MPKLSILLCPFLSIENLKIQIKIKSKVIVNYIYTLIAHAKILSYNLSR